MKVQIYYVLAVALLGLLLWAVCTHSKSPMGTAVRAAGTELGRAALWAGLIAFCLAFSSHVSSC